ncbi:MULTISPECIES: DUF6204 family protein [unclassified Brevibacterium]|uniref:DUF6204 family protein n=1 Tax=unclassified Brevibacterium TaxID=2614124 RepID=UPI000C4BE1A9|nr:MULTISPECIES: DUF6204 family protein [unclassified Brevibacterium]SMX70925.1 hypothetical protein BSP239C_00495 [Brevibacterium sp. 239c]
MIRTYRTTVRGRFIDLDDSQRTSLREAQEDHDMFAARFTPEGTFLYTPELVNYQHRFLLSIDEANPDDADVAASIRAQELSEADLKNRGLDGRTVDVSPVCVEDVKVRSGPRR